jgi:hypothetical protein
MNDARPYIRRPSTAPPSPDGGAVTIGVHSFRWTKRGPEPQHLRDAKDAIKALLTGHAALKGGPS